MITCLEITDSVKLWVLLNQNENMDNTRQIFASLPLMVSNKDFNWNRKILTGIHKDWTPLCVLSIMCTPNALNALYTLSDRHDIDWGFKFTKRRPTLEDTTPLKELMLRLTYSRVLFYGSHIFRQIRGTDDYQTKSIAAFRNIISGALMEYAAVRPQLEQDTLTRHCLSKEYIVFDTQSFIHKVANKANTINDIVQAIYEFKAWLIKCDIKEIYIEDNASIYGRTYAWSTILNLALADTPVHTVNLSPFYGWEWLSFENTNVEKLIFTSWLGSNISILTEIIKNSNINKIQIHNSSWKVDITESAVALFLTEINRINLNGMVTIEIMHSPKLSATIHTGLLQYFEEWKIHVTDNTPLPPELSQIVLEYGKVMSTPHFDNIKKKTSNIIESFSKKLTLDDPKCDFDEFSV